ncbi:hypothetical protein RchiOBHm_Chr3g0452591 [Rosa chinensis]|uniref:Uncharacterized protein n=1 Tax=Rosa chinensis TaxID=74649 RepID=A0A2P6R6B3_ROSCH|nr:uncharacterized protein LOC112192767 isoform X2 [Rosa chinensis]PRQ41973.1 hypothetical protein RchiOBHm_Chr3g0452591 [Rosa chinensis]
MAYNDYGNYRPGYSTGGVGAYTDQWGNPRQSSHPGVVEPVRGYGYAADDSWQRRSSSPVRGGYGYADQPSRIAPSNGVNWRQQPHQTGHYSGTSAGYNDYNDYSNKPSYKHSGKTDHYDDHYSNKPSYKHSGKSDNYDDQYRKNDSSSYGPAVNMISNMVSSRPKPSRTVYSTGALPVRGDGRLTVPTDDMERALHYLKESAKPSPWPRT